MAHIGNTENNTENSVEKESENTLPGVKYDGGKIRMDLLPFDALEEISAVLTYGAKKYAPNNWKHIDNPVERYQAAMLRHFSAYKRGEYIDPESGQSHLGHAACCLLFLIWHEKKKAFPETTK